MSESHPAESVSTKDRAEIASEEGFTGTLLAFLDWLSAALVYGSIRIDAEAPNQFGNPVITVSTVTAGFSSDEHLLSRVSQNLYMRVHWASSHRGGLVVYEFPTDWVTSSEEYVWLEPENGVFEALGRVRRVSIIDKRGDSVEFDYEGGAELLFHEPERDINEPNGLLTVRPLHEGIDITTRIG